MIPFMLAACVFAPAMADVRHLLGGVDGGGSGTGYNYAPPPPLLNLLPLIPNYVVTPMREYLPQAAPPVERIPANPHSLFVMPVYQTPSLAPVFQLPSNEYLPPSTAVQRYQALPPPPIRQYQPPAPESATQYHPPVSSTVTQYQAPPPILVSSPEYSQPVPLSGGYQYKAPARVHRFQY